MAEKKTAAKKAPAQKVSAIKEAEVNFRPHQSTAEEYQPTGFHYAMVSSPKEGRKQCHTWIKCRDFLQDALRNALTGRADQIYSFKYDPKVDPKVDFRRTRVVVKRIPHPDNDAKRQEFTEMMKSGLDLVNHFEDYAGWTPKSKLYRVKGDDKQYSFLFLGPGEWTQSAVGISMYTLLIRLGFFKISFKGEEDLKKKFEEIMSKHSSNDIGYLRTTYKHFYKVLDNYDLVKFQQDGKKKILFEDDNINGFHHHSGIVSLCQFRTPNRELNEKFKKILGS